LHLQSSKLHRMVDRIRPQLELSTISPSPIDRDGQATTPVDSGLPASTINDTSYIRTGYVFDSESPSQGLSGSQEHIDREALDLNPTQVPDSSNIFSTEYLTERLGVPSGETTQLGTHGESFWEMTPSATISFEDLEDLESLMFMETLNYHFY
jgi:hypothetical protein